MEHVLYRDLVDWYPLIDPPADHAEEGVAFRAAFEQSISPPPRTLLELGAGAGHNGLHLKAHYRCTLTDVSPEMVASSRRLNPECEHVVADMRTLRLGRTFDAVLIHDAIMYMLTEDDLRAALRTAFEHTRPGGALIIAPDGYADTFEETVEHQHESEGDRAVALLIWSWDPDPTDQTFRTEYSFVLREGQTIRAVHDSHLEGLFSLATWREVITSTGYQVSMMDRPLGDGATDQIFLCRRP